MEEKLTDGVQHEGVDDGGLEVCVQNHWGGGGRGGANQLQPPSLIATSVKNASAAAGRVRRDPRQVGREELCFHRLQPLKTEVS